MGKIGCQPVAVVQAPGVRSGSLEWKWMDEKIYVRAFRNEKTRHPRALIGCFWMKASIHPAKICSERSPAVLLSYGISVANHAET